MNSAAWTAGPALPDQSFSKEDPFGRLLDFQFVAPINNVAFVAIKMGPARQAAKRRFMIARTKPRTKNEKEGLSGDGSAHHLRSHDLSPKAFSLAETHVSSFSASGSFYIYI